MDVLDRLDPRSYRKISRSGYKTHALGKWDVGFMKKECSPTYRGFDTFFGYYLACEADYWYHAAPFNVRSPSLLCLLRSIPSTELIFRANFYNFKHLCAERRVLTC